MQACLVNWRTTAAGAATILAAAADVCSQAATGHADPVRLWNDLMAVAIGVGLVHAKDQGAK